MIVWWPSQEIAKDCNSNWMTALAILDDDTFLAAVHAQHNHSHKQSYRTSPIRGFVHHGYEAPSWVHAKTVHVSMQCSDLHAWCQDNCCNLFTLKKNADAPNDEDRSRLEVAWHGMA